ncbi:hypothetical protein EZ428_17565 [Pedobacter frigiditerrae]|uniref:Uncharacterized protein n=1 Tax=Pedobacter frigiditerrae TaxID=2530452 RepID=A0A4R0MRC8_9SPHI|nr:hypothetical protein [Pedobacter frigiditerrae]TCC89499.1 hypothetical protein EZ428_17565 [Pedobacter frigiditerrae]
MKKWYLFIFILTFLCFNSYAQQNIRHKGYEEFKEYRNSNEDKPKYLAKMLTILADSSKLTNRQIINVQYHIGRLFEETGKPDSAIVYYDKMLKREPNYEVVHRALGFIYLARTKVFVQEMNMASKEKNVEANAKAYTNYKKLVVKAIPHLEKYQACSPDEETLIIIENLYKSIKDTQSIATIETRLKALSLNCVSLLEDE